MYGEAGGRGQVANRNSDKDVDWVVRVCRIPSPKSRDSFSQESQHEMHGKSEILVQMGDCSSSEIKRIITPEQCLVQVTFCFLRQFCHSLTVQQHPIITALVSSPFDMYW